MECEDESEGIEELERKLGERGERGRKEKERGREWGGVR